MEKILARLHITGLLSRIKIRDKILFLTVVGIVMFIAFSTQTVVLGKKQIHALESIYVEKIIPLDELRKIQLTFREVEFRMAGVISDMVTGTAAVTHLKESIKEVDALWEKAKKELSSEAVAAEREKFERGIKDLRA